MWCLHTILPKLSFSLILSLSARIFLSPGTPALESESSSLPSVHLPHHFRPGMASWSSTPPPLHVSQSDTAMLRKSVSFSEELLLAASGRTHPLLPLWPLTLGAGIASSVTTPTAVLPPGRITCLSLICPNFPQMHWVLMIEQCGLISFEHSDLTKPHLHVFSAWLEVRFLRQWKSKQEKQTTGPQSSVWFHKISFPSAWALSLCVWNCLLIVLICPHAMTR